MECCNTYSVIIPQKNSIESLKRLIDSIPDNDNIEIIIADNSDIPVTREDIGIDRKYNLCWAAPNRYAGGARNEGVKHANGKWLIFADADDYFTSNAFESFDKFQDSDADVVYFCADGIYPETGERSDKADCYTRLVHQYFENPSEDTNIKVSFHVPWAKMVRASFVHDNGFKFDEVIANSDDYFAMLVGLNAKTIEASRDVVYIYTVARGSLTKRRCFNVIKARLEVILRKNQYLKRHGLSHKQASIMYLYYLSAKNGLSSFIKATILIIKYKQNPFIGCSRWLKTYTNKSRVDIQDKKYITN